MGRGWWGSRLCMQARGLQVARALVVVVGGRVAACRSAAPTIAKVVAGEGPLAAHFSSAAANC
jgi:hypothetical protein